VFLPSKDVPQRLADILEYAERVARYVGGRDRETFLADDMARDAVLRCLQCISEAAKKLDMEAERLMPDQPWKGIRGIGNPLRHEYDSIEDHLIWQSVSGCQSLAKACKAALNSIGCNESLPSKG
jgi:uncharacterized protein with HEPN domain